MATQGTATFESPSKSSSSSIYDTELTYDSSSDMYVPVEDPNYDENRKMAIDLYNAVGTAYEKLINSGRTDLAYNLKESADRLSSTGSELGVNSFARQQSITDLYNDMNAAQQVIDDQSIVQMLQDQGQALDRIIALDADAFANFTQGYSEWQAQQNTEWTQQQYEEEQAAATADTETATAEPTSMADANAFHEQSAANLEAAGSDNTSQIAWELPEWNSSLINPGWTITSASGPTGAWVPEKTEDYYATTKTTTPTTTKK